MRQLETVGYTCVHDSAKPMGEIAVINTCGFIGDAKEESINTILQFVERKKKRRLKQLYVMGCLSERYLADLEEEIPEVDGWFGKFDYLNLVQTLTDASHEVNAPTPSACASYERHLTTPRHYAYLKISEGCNRFCSYCAIPLITGRHTSRPMADLLQEVKWLVSQGVHEFNVIAQDLSAYGTDLVADDGTKGHHLLPELIEQMAAIPGVEWIRLHYAYPTDFPMDLLRVMREHSNVCKYLDIALQHCSDHMLSMMRRHISAEEQTRLIQTIRREVPGICIRTTLMVGHPDETEQDFQELKQFAQDMRFERMGAFAFSNEEGTYAAQHYQDNVPEDIKQRRLDELMLLQEDIAREVQQARVGKKLRVVIDREEADYWIGRTEWDSPEVDGEVLIRKENTTAALQPGMFCTVTITGNDEFDLYGEVLD